MKRVQRLRWTAFALGATAFVLAFFHRLAPGAIAGELQQAFGTSSASLGLLSATGYIPRPCSENDLTGHLEKALEWIERRKGI